MDGIIVIDKEKNYTSNDIVQIVKKTLNEKVGHCGTLDPLATGVLPILVGKGTLCSKYLVNHNKIYTATIKLGTKTDTADSEGKVIEEKEVDSNILNKDNIDMVFTSLVGKQEQIPPMYSAIKVNGRKLYEYARKGEKIDVKPRQIEIYEIRCLNINREDREITYRVSCSKGTYIRSLCEDISIKLGTVGNMKELRREKVGIFDVDKAIKINDFKENYLNIEYMNRHFITIEDLFKESEKIKLDKKQLHLILNGVKIKVENENGIYRMYDVNNIFVGIGIVENNLLKRDIILTEK